MREKLKLVYQGKEIETNATTVSAFLAEQKIAVTSVIVEWNGNIYGKAEEIQNLTLNDGDQLNAFRIVAGG